MRVGPGYPYDTRPTYTRCESGRLVEIFYPNETLNETFNEEDVSATVAAHFRMVQVMGEYSPDVILIENNLRILHYFFQIYYPGDPELGGGDADDEEVLCDEEKYPRKYSELDMMDTTANSSAASANASITPPASRPLEAAPNCSIPTAMNSPTHAGESRVGWVTTQSPHVTLSLIHI